MIIIDVPINEVKPYKNNPRQNEKAIEQVRQSIESYGFKQPIVVDKNDIIVVGHTRFYAALDLDLEVVPVLVADDLSDAECKAYRIADNKTSEFAEWDMDLLKIELNEVDDLFTGFSVEELNDLIPDEANSGLTDDDAVSDVPDEPIAKLGDIYQLGNHRLMCGDSTEIDHIEKLMNGKKADMVFTDPPYGMSLETDYSKIKGSSKSIGFKGNLLGNKYDKIIGDNEDFKPELITSIFDNFNYCKEIFMFGADYYIDLLPNYGKDGCLLVWNKRSSDEQQKGIGNTFELFWSKQKHKKYVFNFEWFGFLSRDAPQEARNRVHPSMKPIGLIERIYLWFKLSKYKIVVDPYLGSGSTLIACEKTNKFCYGMELDPRYIDVIIKRWQDFTGKEAIKVGSYNG